MSIVTDRAQGGGSIQDGQVEIMVSKSFIYLVTHHDSHYHEFSHLDSC